MVTQSQGWYQAEDVDGDGDGDADSDGDGDCDGDGEFTTIKKTMIPARGPQTK